jgi:hypothetical protein
MSHSHIALRLGILAVAGASVACSDATPPISKDATPATIIRSITDTLRWIVATSVGELTVTVNNAEGQPLDSATVTFAITGGGSLTTSSTLTDSLGRASTVWTLGMRTGVQTMTATVGTLAPAVFVAVAMPLGGQYVTKIAGDDQSATIGTLVLKNPTVRVTDIYGNPVPKWVVYFFPRNGGLANNNSMQGVRTTDSAGVASVTWRLGPNVGPDTLMVQPSGSTTRVPFVALGLAPP